MSASHPGADALFQVLRDHLAREVSPLLPAPQQFRLRIADRLLEILAREHALGAGAEQRERAGIQSLLDALQAVPAGEAPAPAGPHAGAGDASLETLRAALAGAIREGAIAPDSPALLAHLRASLADALRIDNPRWLPEAMREPGSG